MCVVNVNHKRYLLLWTKYLLVILMCKISKSLQTVNLLQITPFQPPKTGVNGFFKSLKKNWKNLWESLVDFITGETCRSFWQLDFTFPYILKFIVTFKLYLLMMLLIQCYICFLLLCRGKCSGFFDFSCHIQYICMSWIVLFGLLLAIFPTGKPSFSSRNKLWIMQIIGFVIFTVVFLNCSACVAMAFTSERLVWSSLWLVRRSFQARWLWI